MKKVETVAPIISLGAPVYFKNPFKHKSFQEWFNLFDEINSFKSPEIKLIKILSTIYRNIDWELSEFEGFPRLNSFSEFVELLTVIDLPFLILSFLEIYSFNEKILSTVVKVCESCKKENEFTVLFEMVKPSYIPNRKVLLDQSIYSKTFSVNQNLSLTFEFEIPSVKMLIDFSRYLGAPIDGEEISVYFVGFELFPFVKSEIETVALFTKQVYANDGAPVFNETNPLKLKAQLLDFISELPPEFFSDLLLKEFKNSFYEKITPKLIFKSDCAFCGAPISHQINPLPLVFHSKNTKQIFNYDSIIEQIANIFLNLNIRTKLNFSDLDAIFKIPYPKLFEEINKTLDKIIEKEREEYQKILREAKKFKRM